MFNRIHSKEGLLSILPDDGDSAETTRSHAKSL